MKEDEKNPQKIKEDERKMKEDKRR